MVARKERERERERKREREKGVEGEEWLGPQNPH
jgi:hypothetical protein